MDTLWAAVTSTIEDKKPTRAPRGIVWKRQVESSLRWIMISLKGAPGTLTRTWPFEEFVNTQGHLTMTLDASPWGLGGVLQRGSTIIAWFSSPLSHHVARIHRSRIGCNKGQQKWEALAYLVALRAWQDFWADRRLQVTVRSDNLAALFMGAQTKSKTPPLISKEVALVYSESAFESPRFRTPSGGSECDG